MMLKVNDEFLDFNEDIFVEKSAKLIDSISENTGDFSYSFTISKTAKNKRIINQYSVNQSNKVIYNKIPSEIQNNGLAHYTGYIQILSENSQYFNAAFFSGNTNWFNVIDGTLYEIDLTEFDVDNTEANIVASWANSSGVVFPVIDKGVSSRALSNRFVKNDITRFQYNDFHPFIYVKDLFNKIFQSVGIKFTGDLFEDPLYNKLIVTSNPARVASERVESRTSIAGRLTSQSVTSTPAKIMLVDTDPFEDGSANLWDNTLSRYTSDSQMNVDVTFDFSYSVQQQYVVDVYKTGVLNRTLYFPKSGTVFNTYLDIGDYLEFEISAASAANLRVGSKITIKPTFFRRYFISDFMPDMTKREFVDCVFKMFNVVTSFDEKSYTLNCSLFKSIKNKPEADWSDYVSDYTIDYERVYQNLYRRNLFLYQEQEIDKVVEYNASNAVPLGAGSININNDFVEESGNIVELPAIAPYSYYNDAFQMWLMNLNYISLSRGEEREIISVTDSGGTARFNYTGSAVGVGVGVVVEIYDTDDDTYEGIGIISSVNPGWFEVEGLAFVDNQTGYFTVMSYDPIDSPEPLFAIHVSNIPVSDFSQNGSFYINDAQYSTASYAYFYKPRLNLNIDDEVYSLSFGRGSELQDYQIPLIENYYSDFEDVITDPAIVICEMNVPFDEFISFDFLSPIRIKTDQFNCKMYCNKILNYQGREYLCEGEFIKLG